MARKSMKDAAAAGTSVFDQIASGYVQNANGVQDVQGVQGAKDAQPDKIPTERLNLRIPADVKAYLMAAAYRESSPTKQVSLTEYLVNLVRADMEKHKDD